MSTPREITDDIVNKIEDHGVYKVGYPDRRAAERLVKQLRDALASERAALTQLFEADREYDAAKVGMYLAEGKPVYQICANRFIAAGAARTAVLMSLCGDASAAAPMTRDEQARETNLRG